MQHYLTSLKKESPSNLPHPINSFNKYVLCMVNIFGTGSKKNKRDLISLWRVWVFFFLNESGGGGSAPAKP